MVILENHSALEIDNNLVENAIRPTAIGKKNFLFIGSPNAGKTSAVIYSLVETCRKLEINPADYLHDALQALPTMEQGEAANWTPARWKLRHEDLGGIGTDDDIVCSRSVDNGQNWNTPIAVNSTAGSDGGDFARDLQPDLITDGDSVWVVVWFSNSDISGSNTDYDIMFSRSVDNGVSWSAAAFLNSNFTNSSSDWRPRVMTDGKGAWITVWASRDNYQGAGSDDIDYSFPDPPMGAKTGAQRSI